MRNIWNRTMTDSDKRSTIIYGTWFLLFIGAVAMCHYVGPFISGIHDKALEDHAIAISLFIATPPYVMNLLRTDFGRCPEKKKRFWTWMAIETIVIPITFYFAQFI